MRPALQARFQGVVGVGYLILAMIKAMPLVKVISAAMPV